MVNVQLYILNVHGFHEKINGTSSGCLVLHMRISQDIHVLIPVLMHQLLVHEMTGKLLHLKINPQAKRRFMAFIR